MTAERVVAVDHGARLVAGAVSDPGLGATGSQRERDEDRALLNDARGIHGQLEHAVNELGHVSARGGRKVLRKRAHD